MAKALPEVDDAGRSAVTRDFERDPRDKRASRLAILNEPTDYSKQPNRLSNVRWPLGEEPHHDVEGTDPDDPFVNIKLEVVEGADPDPDQKSLLNLNGPLIRMKCAHCGQQLRIGASKKNKEVLEEGGFSFKPYQIVAHMNDELAACVCPNGHVTQLRMDMAMRLRQHV